jgi:DNA-binding transcriptional regulator YiaG
MAREHLAAQLDGLSSPVNGSGRKTMAKMDVRKADEGDLRVEIGRAVRLTRGTLSLKEFAAAIVRDERQIARWEEGKERPHVDAIFAVRAFRLVFIEALAGLDDDVQVQTVITIRRTA